MRRNLLKLCIYLFLFLFITGCEKEVTDLASIITGTYKGTIKLGSLTNYSIYSNCTSVLEKDDETNVTLKIKIGTTNINIPEKPGIHITDEGNNVYSLAYLDDSGLLQGEVYGKSLTWTFSLFADNTEEIFDGTKE